MRRETLTGISQKQTSRARLHVLGLPIRQETHFLNAHQIPVEFQEPYIVSGYRSPHLTARQCVQSLFQCHNETANVWTHAIATALYIVWMLYLQLSGTVSFLDDSYALPLLAMFIGFGVCTLLSSLAHLFSCMSQQIRHVCFYFDYAGVTMAGLSGMIGNYYYSQPEDVSLYEWSFPYIMTIQVVCCAMACYVCCVTRHQAKNCELRIVSFTLPYIIGTMPLVQRMWYADQWSFVLSTHLTHIIVTTMGSLIYAIKVPERMKPGSFDYVGHSHCIMHLLTTAGSFVHMYASAIDMKTRRGLVPHGPVLTVSEVFGPMRTLLVAQGIIIGHFTYQLLKHGFKESESTGSCGKRQ